MRKQYKYLAKTGLSAALSISLVMSSMAGMSGTEAGFGTLRSESSQEAGQIGSERDGRENTQTDQDDSKTDHNADTGDGDEEAGAGDQDSEEILLEEDDLQYEGEEVLLDEGDILTELDFSSSSDPAKIVKKAFDKASKYSSDGNIEGPQGKNCAVASASNWKDNGNLSVVDLASASDAEKVSEYDGAEVNAAGILWDTHVFRYYLHGEKDFDRNTSITDRQRIELKTESNNLDINSICGDILTARWKFFLPEDTPLPNNQDPLGEVNNFFHIFQTKATKGDESSMPVFTFTVNDEELVFEGSDCGHVNEDLQHIDSVDIHQVLGKWMEAEVTTYTAEQGYVYVSLKDISDPAAPKELMDTGYSIDNWRRPEREEHREGSDRHYYEYDAPAVKDQLNRSKWGLYRKIFEDGFDEAVMYLGDLQIIKHDPEAYVFPDGFTPCEQPREISWAVKADPVLVLEGTDPGNIYLPSQVEVYVDANEKELIDVVWDWETSDYDQSVKGTYTVYGTLVPEDGIENSNDVHAQAEVCVTDDLSQKRVNWALGTEFGGSASVKTVGGSESNPSSCLIDGSEETYWSTHSGLIVQNEEDNGGWRYWAAIDLGAVRSFDEIYYALGTIGSSKQFRLHNYSMYYTNTAEAYEELQGGTTGNPRTKGVTPNPLLTSHGDAWEAIEGVYKENIISEGKKEVTNNIQHRYVLDEPVEAQYVLVLGEIETIDATAGAIQTKVLKLIGDKAEADIPQIRKVALPEQITVEPGTDFEALGLPSQVEVTLADQTSELAFVTWNQADYQSDTEGIYRITGSLSFAEDKMQNPELLEAEAYVEVKHVPEKITKNWVLEDHVEVKAVSAVSNSANKLSYLIDGDRTTSWATHSSLVKSGFPYWAAVDLGAERCVDRLEAAWESTGNRLDNYRLYYAPDTAEAALLFESLKGGNDLSTEKNQNQVTRNPLDETDLWTLFEGAFSDTTVKKNTAVVHKLNETVCCRYILLFGEVNEEESAGAIKTSELNVFGTAGEDQKPVSVKSIGRLDPVTVAYGTPFGAVRLPETVAVELENGTFDNVPVHWMAGSYSKTDTGSVWVTGKLMLPENLTNPEELQVQIQLNIEGSEIARRASVVFMEDAKSEFVRYESVIVGSRIDAPVNEPKKEGYEFAGWCLDAEGTIRWNQKTDRLTAAGLVLYASWKEAPEVPDIPTDPENPEQPDKPEQPDNPDMPEQPGIPEKPDIPLKPGNSNGSSDGDSDGGSPRYMADGRSDGQWQQDEIGWKLRWPDSTYSIGRWEKVFWNGSGRWFFFGNDGYMKTGWLKDSDGKMYYLNPVSDGNQGAMLTGWQLIDGKWYYFNPVSDGYQGMMVTNAAVDGYVIGEDGAADRS